MTIIAAVDGSALGNPGPAGWAWYVDDDTWAAGGWPHGTNNMGELQAVLELLRATADRADEHLEVLCDSQYVINTVTKWRFGWKKRGWRKADGKPVLNVEQIKAIDAALTERDVAFEWVRGHTGHTLNEAADQRARAAALAHQAGRDPEPGPGFGAAQTVPAGVPDRVAGGVLDSTSDHGGASDHDDTHDGTFDREDTHDDTSGHGDRFVEERPVETSPVATTATGSDPEDEQIDLFASLEASCFVGPGSSAAEECIALERALLDETVRSSRDRVADLLHEDFREVGRSGRVFDRAAMLRSIGPIGPIDVVAADFAAREIGPGVVLVTYRTTDDRGAAQRSSVWVRSGDELASWRVRFHQGTPEE